MTPAHLIQDAGGVFVRTAKHGDIYRLPNGRTIMANRRPTDPRALTNLRADLARLTKETTP